MNDKPALSLRRFLSLIAVGALLCLGYALAVWWAFSADWKSSADFGETFGALNAFFSWSAFAGVIFTILLQREELRLQREELALTRHELQRTAEAQEKSERNLQEQAKALRATARLNAMSTLVRVYSDKIEEIKRIDPGLGDREEYRRTRTRLAEITEALENALREDGEAGRETYNAVAAPDG